MLQDEFENIFISTEPNKAIADFDRNKPLVLILAINTLEMAERKYLGFYRLCISQGRRRRFFDETAGLRVLLKKAAGCLAGEKVATENRGQM